MLDSRTLVKFRKLSHVGLGAIFVTAISGNSSFIHCQGAFVAGLDAGMIYNEFPKMGEGYIPADLWALSVPSSYNLNPIPWWKNLLENPAAVQFIHRVLVIRFMIVDCIGGLYSHLYWWSLGIL
jgi:cytochrome c oxidase assembly protein subunit 15